MYYTIIFSLHTVMVIACQKPRSSTSPSHLKKCKVELQKKKSEMRLSKQIKIHNG